MGQEVIEINFDARVTESTGLIAKNKWKIQQNETLLKVSEIIRNLAEHDIGHNFRPKTGSKDFLMFCIALAGVKARKTLRNFAFVPRHASDSVRTTLVLCSLVALKIFYSRVMSEKIQVKFSV